MYSAWWDESHFNCKEHCFLYFPPLVISYLKKPLTSASAVVFPESVADLEGSLDLDYIPAQVQLPAKLFEQRRESLSEYNCTINFYTVVSLMHKS